jgi:hypothetical protein
LYHSIYLRKHCLTKNITNIITSMQNGVFAGSVTVLNDLSVNENVGVGRDLLIGGSCTISGALAVAGNVIVTGGGGGDPSNWYQYPAAGPVFGTTDTITISGTLAVTESIGNVSGNITLGQGNIQLTSGNIIVTQGYIGAPSAQITDIIVDGTLITNNISSSLTTLNISADSVTICGNPIISGNVVNSISGLSGNLQLFAGSNITITQSDQAGFSFDICSTISITSISTSILNISADSITICGNPIVTTANVVTSISAAGTNRNSIVEFTTDGVATIGATASGFEFGVNSLNLASNWSIYPALQEIKAFADQYISLSGDTIINGTAGTQYIGFTTICSTAGFQSISIGSFYTAGYDRIHVQMWGGAGGYGLNTCNSNQMVGGAGGYVEFTAPLTLASINLNISIAGVGQSGLVSAGTTPSGGFPDGGSGGSNALYPNLAGGGGGGATYFAIDSSLLAIAAGGGGGAPNGFATVIYGGAGGGQTGQAGLGFSFGGSNAAGGGGTPSSGGSNGNFTNGGGGGNGTVGASNLGGAGASSTGFAAGGGGGGGGLYGGGGGSAYIGGGGPGGGGSSWIDSVNTSGIIFVNGGGNYYTPASTDSRVPYAGYAYTGLTSSQPYGGAIIITGYSSSSTNLQYAALQVSGGVRASEYVTNTQFITSLANTQSWTAFVAQPLGQSTGNYVFTAYSSDASAAITSANVLINYAGGAFITSSSTTIAGFNFNIINASGVQLSNGTGATLSTIYSRYTKLG